LHRPVGKYTRQPRLMRLRRMFIYQKVFIIWRNRYCFHLLLEIAAPKPEIWYSILIDPDLSKPSAGTQKTGLRQPAESVRVFLWL
jgi:hypothetical protein